MKRAADEIDWDRLLNIPYGSLATKLSPQPVWICERVIRLRPQLYASCGATTAKTGYRLYRLLWVRGDNEAQLIFDSNGISKKKCNPLAAEELPALDWCPTRIRSWMYRDVKAAARGGVIFSSNMRGYLYTEFRRDAVIVYYSSNRHYPTELPFAIEILMRRRGAPRRIAFGKH